MIEKLKKDKEISKGVLKSSLKSIRLLKQELQSLKTSVLSFNLIEIRNIYEILDENSLAKTLSSS